MLSAGVRRLRGGHVVRDRPRRVETRVEAAPPRPKKKKKSASHLDDRLHPLLLITGGFIHVWRLKFYFRVLASCGLPEKPEVDYFGRLKKYI